MLPMATPTKASQSMNSACFRAFVKLECSKTTERNFKRVSASSEEFWLHDG
jgi:hypothetical protein